MMLSKDEREIIRQQLDNIPDDIAKLLIVVFGDLAKVELWLCTPNKVLNGDDPLTKLSTDKGVDEVGRVLRKIESGEFS